MLSVSAAEPSSQSRRDVGGRRSRCDGIGSKTVTNSHGSSLSRGPGSNGNLQPQDDGLTGQGMVGEAGLEQERERGEGV